ncbi:MAG TPA: Mut7-C RNAse domain-containing protein [Candidatus Hydrothermia bacterium]|nr:Mut7-C RNAse domain-containing protein [Candidatus Hydrothermae bacterium]HRD22370.1 Mut7-C RNAse domain-containing protein [Candidatus Hydrothermia bacterium]
MNFLCDSMMGKLSKLLRMCGFDADYYKPGLNLENIKNFEGEDRVILTRNQKFKKYVGPLKIYFSEHDDPLMQLRQVLKEFQLADKVRFLSRCMECNEEIVPVDKESVRGKVPFYVFDNYETFLQCPKCRRVYWEGTHVEKMRDKLRRVLE